MNSVADSSRRNSPRRAPPGDGGGTRSRFVTAQPFVSRQAAALNPEWQRRLIGPLHPIAPVFATFMNWGLHVPAVEYVRADGVNLKREMQAAFEQQEREGR